jgi:hypothetical protein
MADKKITQLDAVTTAANTDLLLIVRDPSTTPVNKKLELGDLFGETAQTVVTTMNLRASGSGTINANSLTLTSPNQVTLTRGVVINENGDDSDTRIESDGNPNMIFVDASTNRVGIGTSSPAQVLDIEGNAIRLRDANLPASSNNLAVGWPVGTIAWTENHLYIAANNTTIKRIAWSTF